MDITKHLVKPVEVEILGEKVQMKPLRAKHYVIVTKLQYLSLKAQDIAEYNEKHKDNPRELSKEERQELIDLDIEISFLTLSEVFNGLKKSEFDELPIKVISTIMGVFWSINNPNTGELEEAKKELLD